MYKVLVAFAVVVGCMSALAERPGDAVEVSLRRALAAMETRQHSGGWGNAWTLDDSIMWGEYRTRPSTWVTVQPPATPGIATVFLDAARVLGDAHYAERARMARDALLAVQTPDGGFPYEADPAGPKPLRATFDDNTTTGALDFLIAWWTFTKDPEDRKAIDRVGAFLLKAQYPDSGGWPQEYPPVAMTYSRHITFNDSAMQNVMRALLKLHTLTGDARYLDAAVKGGDCIIKLQGGPGEEIWAAQYDPKTLKPAWARKFEPPAYSSCESADVCDVLIDLYLATGLDRFLDPLPNAFAWYDAHRLPNGKWARFYEAGTQRPVYGRRDKAEPVYDLAQATGGYSWQGDWYPRRAENAYQRIKEIGRDAYAKERTAPAPREVSEDQARQVCDQLSADGWWLSRADFDQTNQMKESHVPEQQIVESGTFCRNARLLLTYLERFRNKG